MLGKKLRNYFFTGLFAILPITVTIYILFIGFHWTDGILGNLLKHLIGRPIPGLGLFIILVLLTLAGMVMTNFFGRRIVSFFEKVIMQIPLVGSIYGTTKQITEAISSPEKAVFRSVVMVEYPRIGTYSLGFKIGDPPDGMPENKAGGWVTVFIPTVPNPATGFVLIFPEEEVLTMPMTVEDGFKYFVSAGVVRPEKNKNVD